MVERAVVESDDLRPQDDGRNIGELSDHVLDNGPSVEFGAIVDEEGKIAG